MALDGALLHCIKEELSASLQDAKIDKIHQPSKEELVFAMRGRQGSKKVYISTRPSSPRIHLVAKTPENPDVPPMFCMLLRKRLTGGRLVAIRQNGIERALYLDFDCINELGDPVRLTLAVELMGRFSNVLLLDETGMIIDVLKRVDWEMSPTRPLLPGLRYELPIALAKKQDVFLTSAQSIVSAVLQQPDRDLADAIVSVTCGVSPLICREIAHQTTRGVDTTVSKLTDDQIDRLHFYLERVKKAMETSENRQPYMLLKENAPYDYSFIPIAQYGLSVIGRKFSTFSEMLEEFYEKRDAAQRMKQRSQDILRVLTNANDRITRKLANQQDDLRRSEKRETKRMYGDLINANLHLAQRGASSMEVINYFDEQCPTVTIPLNPALSASQNAQRYYKEYRKAQTAEKILTEQIEQGKQELQYIDTVFDALTRATTGRELDELRQELISSGYMRVSHGKKVKLPPPLPPIHCVSDDGFDIYIGRNNVQNDRLTMKTAHGSDWWFHTKNMAGSHVILMTNGQIPPDRTVEQAAILAATHSKAAASSQVPVDYTPVRYVKKPAGAKPGKVIYETNKTMYVTPDEMLLKRLCSDAK